MTNINDPISVNFYYKKYQTIPLKQYDNNTRQLTIKLYDREDEYVVGSGVEVILRCTKPDKTCILFTVDSANINGNTLVIQLPESITSCAGLVVCDIGIYEAPVAGQVIGKNVLSSQLFYLEVEKSAYDDTAVLSSDDYAVLTRLISETKLLIETCTNTLTLQENQFASLKTEADVLIHEMKTIIGSANGTTP